MGIFAERIPFKPFEYPVYYTEGWLKQAQAFWLHTEIPMHYVADLAAAVDLIERQS